MSRRRRHEEHENHERWLVSYADFITLLFAFFVVLYATSNSDTEKQKSFEESVRASLKLAIVGMGSGGGGSGMATDPKGSMLPQLINPVDDFKRRNPVQETQDFVDRQVKRIFSQEELDRPVLTVKHDSRGARLSIAEEILFPAGDSKLKKSSVEVLDKVAALLKQTDRVMVFEGHVDSSTGWDVGGSRATNVARYFIKRRAVAPGQVSAVSSADADEKNRRIEILITADSADLSGD